MIWSREYIRGLLECDHPIKGVFELADIWSTRSNSNARDFGLLPCEFVVHLYLKYQGEVGNGGHVQFFMNPAGAYANETLSALTELKFLKIHKILSRAVEVFPIGLVPKDWDQRIELISKLGDDAVARWGVLDQELYSIDSAHWPLVQEYLREHEAEILERNAS